MTAVAKPGMPEPLLHAFLNTDYLVDFGRQVIAVRIGSRHRELDTLAKAQTWSIISACNPGARQQPETLNREHGEALERIARIDGLQTWPVINRASGDDWPDEPALLVVDPTPDWVHTQARTFGQLGVVSGGSGEHAELWLYLPAGQVPDLPHVRAVGP
jgi:hypothetical protein